MRRRLSADDDDALTPFMDVQFIVLAALLFFVRTEEPNPVTVPHVPPGGTADATQDHARLIWISLDADGSLTLEGGPVAEADLLEKVRQALADRGEDQVVLKADDGAGYGHVFRIRDALSREGIVVLEQGRTAQETDQ